MDLSLLGDRAAAIHWFETIDSTMHEAARLAAAGAPSGTVVAADEQTAGHGRQGRGWDSQRGAGLYLSIVLRIADVAVAELPLVTLALGLAAAEAIRSVAGVACDLRWPNDVLIEERKCCGILTELHGTAVVAGIGVNVNQILFPEGIRDLATSLRMACGRVVSREILLAELLESIDLHVAVLARDGKRAILRLFEDASSYVRGRRVVVDGSLLGTTIGLNDDGFLRVRGDDGVDSVVIAGGVRPVE